MPARRPILASLALMLALAPPLRAAESPFDPGLSRLAEVLGSLHFLSSLCDRRETDWRAAMEEILDTEKPDEARRARFVASFNRGYRSFADSYRTCTPSASAALALYVREGEELSRRLAERFGN